MTSAARMRSLRRRAASGKAVLSVEVDVDRLALALVEDNFLPAWNDTDRAAITVAVERMLVTYAALVLGDV